MAVAKPCLGCGILTRAGSWCPSCQARRQPDWAARRRVGNGWAWGRIRDHVRARDGNTCVRCGSSHNLEVHHRVPLAHGGTNSLDNLETLCHACHRRRVSF